MPKARTRAVTALKETLISRFGTDFKELIESEVEGRLQGRSKLEREDLDAIEHIITATRRERRGGKPLPRKVLSRSVPDLKAQAPPASMQRSASGLESRTAPSAPSETAPRPRKERRPAPYAVSIMEEDAMSERSRVEVKPKYPVPLPPKLKPMDHWDLIVAFDTAKFRQEYADYVKAGKHEQQSKVKNILDEQMKECHKMWEEKEKARRQERQDMLDQIQENKRLSQAEKAQRDAIRDKAKEINEMSLESLRRRRKAEEERRQREQETMLKWMQDEHTRQREQRKADAEEHARKCQQAKDEMNEAIAEAARRKKARQDEDKAFAQAGEKAADDAEAKNRAAVQARLDQIERNCEIIGAEIAGRDARIEAELQAKIQKIQEDADRASKEDADRRKAERDAKVRSMLDSLDLQMKQREEDAQREKDENIKQAQIWKREYEEGLAADRAKEEKARQAREMMDQQLVAIMRRNARIHPRDFGAELTQQQECAYNRGLYEKMASENFMMPLTSHFLDQATHTGKLEPFPSVGRYKGDIHPLEEIQQDM